MSRDAFAPVHVVDGLQQLEHVPLDALLRQKMPPSPNELVDVHVHQLEHES